MRREDALLSRDEEAVFAEEEGFVGCADADVDDDDGSSGGFMVEAASTTASTSAAKPRSRLTGDDERRERRGCRLVDELVMQKMERTKARYDNRRCRAELSRADQSGITVARQIGARAAIKSGGAARRPGAGPFFLGFRLVDHPLNAANFTADGPLNYRRHGDSSSGGFQRYTVLSFSN